MDDQELGRIHTLGVQCKFTEVSLLFQRAAFLLTANAFLVGGFVTVVTKNLNEETGELGRWGVFSSLASGIAIFGIAICAIDLVSGWLAATSTKMWERYVFQIEKRMSWYQQRLDVAGMSEIEKQRPDPGRTNEKDTSLPPPFMWIHANLAPDDVRKMLGVDRKTNYLRRTWYWWVRWWPAAPFAWITLPAALIGFWAFALCKWV